MDQAELERLTKQHQREFRKRFQAGSEDTHVARDEPSFPFRGLAGTDNRQAGAERPASRLRGARRPRTAEEDDEYDADEVAKVIAAIRRVRPHMSRSEALDLIFSTKRGADYLNFSKAQSRRANGG